MPPRIALALVLHNHQPVGNFGWVFEDVWRHAYAPFIAALEAHPTLKGGLHYTGPLLDWIESEHPEGLERLVALATRGQVEMLGGALTEPILASLPEADRHGQLMAMRARVEDLFGTRPRGAWLAERVWEPQICTDLVRAGYAYTIVDDNHLRAASIRDDEAWGTYSTDDQGNRLTLFGSEQGLRYHIPWSPVDEVIDHLRRNATEDGRRIGVMGDDGEKFGAWPGTHELCWSGQRWVERLLVALEANADWIETVTPGEWLDREPPIGRVYVPSCSYVEMTEWALPPTEAPIFHDLLDEARRHGSSAARFLYGAPWRNFQARYREVNDLHKQMLRASAAVAAMPPGADRDRATYHLYRGQSNDVYWHGLFGGIYLTHLRMAVQAELIAAQDLADGGAPQTRLADLDLDGIDEVQLGSAGQSVAVDVAEGAGIGAWDLAASRVALGSVLRRRPESYHRRLLEHLARVAAEAALASAGAPAELEDPAGFDVGDDRGSDEAGPAGGLDVVAAQAVEAVVAGEGVGIVAAQAVEAVVAGEGVGIVAAQAVEAVVAGEGVGVVAAQAVEAVVAGEGVGVEAVEAVVAAGAPGALVVKDRGLAELLAYDRHELRGGLVELRDLAAAADVGPRELAAVRDVDLGDFADRPFEIVDLGAGSVRLRRQGTLRQEGSPVPLTIDKRIACSGIRLEPALDVEARATNAGMTPAAFELDLSFCWNVAGGGHNPAAYYALPTAGYAPTGVGSGNGPPPATEAAYAPTGVGGANRTPPATEAAYAPTGVGAEEGMPRAPDAGYAPTGVGAEEGMPRAALAADAPTIPHDVEGDLAQVDRLAFGNRQLGVHVTMQLSRPGRVTWFPVETVSNSEGGYERVYQGSSLHLRWPVTLEPGESAAFGVRFVAHQSRDLTAEERLPDAPTRQPA